MHLEKTRTYACTFPVQRKEINVVKVRFTMRYSSRKLSNDKVITTACNFWRQIACSFQVMSGNILFLGKKSFEIPPFFQTRPGDLGRKVHACSLHFSALKSVTILANWTSNLTVLSRKSTRVEIRCSPLTFEFSSRSSSVLFKTCSKKLSIPKSSQTSIMSSDSAIFFAGRVLRSTTRLFLLVPVPEIKWMSGNIERIWADWIEWMYVVRTE